MNEIVTGNSETRHESTRLACAIESVDRLISLWKALYGDHTMFQRYDGDEVVFQSYRAVVMRCLKDEPAYLEVLCVARDLIPLSLPTQRRLYDLERGVEDWTVSHLQELHGRIIGLAFELGQPHRVDYFTYGNIDIWDEESADRYQHLLEEVKVKKDAWRETKAAMAQLQWAGILEDPFAWSDSDESTEPQRQEESYSHADDLAEPEAVGAVKEHARPGRKSIVIDWSLASRIFWDMKSELQDHGDYRNPSHSEVCDRLSRAGNPVASRTFRKRLADDGIQWPPAELNEDHLAA